MTEESPQVTETQEAESTEDREEDGEKKEN